VSGSSRSARRADRAQRERKRRRRRRRNIVAALIVIIVLGGGAYAVVQWGLPLFEGLGSTQDGPAEDYPGPGTGEVEVSIPAGATGTAMAEILVEADVVASSRAFTRAFAANPDAAGIQPGTYRLLLQMRAADAVAALLNSENKVQTNVTVPEGFRVTQILERLASTTGVTIEEFQAAMADPAATGLPAEAGGNYEGWLFPATYTFEPGTTPVQMISTMIAETVRVLDERAVPVESREELLIKASLVERESPGADASPMMARAIQNRLDIGMKLDIDASVAYGANKSGVDLTTADLEDANNPYNTYVHAGLPPGPIASPGTVSIDAVLNPAAGPWKFWVTVNLDTGETRFAETFEEHLQNQELLRQWQAENE
jgi:UPF0755 protein